MNIENHTIIQNIYTQIIDVIDKGSNIMTNLNVEKYITKLLKYENLKIIKRKLLTKLYTYYLFEKKPKKGHVYCLWNNCFSYYKKEVYKLGMAKNLKKRLGGYSSAYIDESILKFTSSRIFYYDIAERQLFHELWKYRVSSRREFFCCSLELIKQKITKINNIFIDRTSKEFSNFILHHIETYIDNLNLSQYDNRKNSINKNKTEVKMKININELLDIIKKNKSNVSTMHEKKIIKKIHNIGLDVLSLSNLPEIIEVIDNTEKYNKFWRTSILFNEKCASSDKQLKKILCTLKKIEKKLNIKRFDIKNIKNVSLKTFQKWLINNVSDVSLFWYKLHGFNTVQSRCMQRIYKIDRHDKLIKFIADIYNTFDIFFTIKSKKKRIKGSTKNKRVWCYDFKIPDIYNNYINLLSSK